MARTTNGSIYRRGKSKNYSAVYTINGKTTRRLLRDKDGNPTASKPDAEKLLHDLLNPLKLKDKQETVQQISHSLEDLDTRIEKAEKDLEPVLKINEAWKAYESSQNRPDSGPQTMIYYKGQWHIFTRWLKKSRKFQVVALRDITPEIAEAYAAKITGSSPSANTFNKCMTFLKLFFRVLQKKAQLEINPFEHITRKKKNTQSRRELTVQELVTILEKATGDLYILFLLGATTGLRLGDCCTLKWGEVDLVRQIIRRIPNKTARRENSNPVRVGIPPKLLDVLSHIPDKTGYVLPDMARRYNKDSLRAGITKQIRKHFEACGIRCHKEGTGVIIKDGKKVKTGKRAIVEVGFHSLRHTYVSLHAERGTPAAIIQGNVGHGNPAMTAHYTHISDAAAVEVAKVLDFTGVSVQAGQEAPVERQRERLKRLADSLPIETVDEILEGLQRKHNILNERNHQN